MLADNFSTKNLNIFLPIIFVVAMQISWVGCNSNQPNSALSSEDVEVIRAALNTYATGWNAENPQKTILDLFVEDAVFLPHHGAAQVEGKENIEKHFWPAGLSGFKVNSYDFEIREFTGAADLAYSSGRYSISFSFENNGVMQTLNNAGNYVMIFRKVNSEWKISRYIWNDPVPQEQ